MSKEKIEYNGWIIFILVMGILCTDDYVTLGFAILAVAYVSIIEWLRLTERISIARGKEE